MPAPSRLSMPKTPTPEERARRRREQETARLVHGLSHAVAMLRDAEHSGRNIDALEEQARRRADAVPQELWSGDEASMVASHRDPIMTSYYVARHEALSRAGASALRALVAVLHA